MYIHVVIMHIYIAQFSYFFLCLLLKRVDMVIEVLKQIAPVQVRRAIRDKMRSRFDVITIPRNVTVNDFCLAFVINLVRNFLNQNIKFPD